MGATTKKVAVWVPIIAAVIGIYVFLSNSINSRIEEKINDPNFVKKVASEIRLPFLIIDESEHIIHDDNAFNLLNSIKVEKEKKEVVSITISPKAFMQIPPIIENMNSNLVFNEPERVNQIDWRFKVNKEAGGFIVTESHKEPIKKFKLTFIKR
jgi:hypothetical protein